MSAARGAGALEKRALVNLAGVVIPAAAALLAMPALTRALGIDRFAVLMLVWTAVSYFALLDLGLGRALSHHLSQGTEREGDDKEPVLLGTALALTACISAVVAAIAAPFVGIISATLASPDGCDAAEASAVVWLSLAMLPLASLANVLTDALQAWGRVDLLNLVRIPVAVLFVVAPLVVYPATRSFPLALLAMVGVRAAALAALTVASARARPGCLRARFSRQIAHELARFGGWAAISHFVRPLLLYLDRFLIVALLPLSAVAYYATPQEALIKLVAVPATFMSIVFPAMARVRGDARSVSLLSQTWHRHVFVVVVPLAAVFLLLGPELLRLWLGADFAAGGGLIVRVLAIGMLANALGQVPFTVIQAVGRPDLAARLHLWEVPLYAVAASGLIVWLGPLGAAIAWSARNVVDCLALLALSPVAAPGTTHRTGWRVTIVGEIVGAAMLLLVPLPLRLVGLGAVLFAVAWLAAKWWRDPARTGVAGV